MTMMPRLTKEEKKRLQEKLNKINGEAEITLEMVRKVNNGKWKPDK